MQNYISIGKIINFFGIKGEARVGYSNFSQLKNAVFVYMLDSEQKEKLKIKSVRLSKNAAIVKFEGIDDINSLLPFKGQRMFVLKQEALKYLEKDEFLINDLIGCIVFDNENNKIGEVVDVSQNSSQYLLNVKNLIGKVCLVPFVNDFFPSVDIKTKKIIINPIEGLLS